jgi:hypothetical protein
MTPTGRRRDVVLVVFLVFRLFHYVRVEPPVNGMHRRNEVSQSLNHRLHVVEQTRHIVVLEEMV